MPPTTTSAARVWLLYVLLTALAALPPAAARDDPRITWLKNHAITLHSIDPADEDFADLEPLRWAIGDARIVQLGEQSHQDGATFHAKARLIKFLHQKMGFDVLAVESGLYDCRKASTAMLAPINKPLNPVAANLRKAPRNTDFEQ
jgi:hypothetical protein